MFSFVAGAFVVISTNSLLNLKSREFIPLFLLRILALIFRSLIHFEVVFIYCVRHGFNFIHWQVKIQLSENHILKRLFYLIEWSWVLFENKLAMHIWIYFFTLNCIPLVYLSILMLAPLCFQYVSFV